MTRWAAWSGPRPRSPRTPRAMTAQDPHSRTSAARRAGDCVQEHRARKDHAVIRAVRPESCTRPWRRRPRARQPGWHHLAIRIQRRHDFTETSLATRPQTPEVAVLYRQVAADLPFNRHAYSAICPHDRFGLRELLTFRSGTVYWDSWSPPARTQIEPSAPAMLGSACRPARRSQRVRHPGEMTQPEPAFSARHDRRESTRRRIRRPGATQGFAWPGHRQDHQQLWLPVWLPNDHLKLRKTVGAAGFEPAAPRL